MWNIITASIGVGRYLTHKYDNSIVISLQRAELSRITFTRGKYDQRSDSPDGATVGHDGAYYR